MSLFKNDDAGAFLGRTPYPVGAVVVKQRVTLNYRLPGGKWAFETGRDRPNGVSGIWVHLWLN